MHVLFSVPQTEMQQVTEISGELRQQQVVSMVNTSTRTLALMKSTKEQQQDKAAYSLLVYTLTSQTDQTLMITRSALHEPQHSQWRSSSVPQARSFYFTT